MGHESDGSWRRDPDVCVPGHDAAGIERGKRHGSRRYAFVAARRLPQAAELCSCGSYL